jgi:hypothetical protein
VLSLLAILARMKLEFSKREIVDAPIGRDAFSARHTT